MKKDRPRNKWKKSIFSGGRNAFRFWKGFPISVCLFLFFFLMGCAVEKNAEKKAGKDTLIPLTLMKGEAMKLPYYGIEIAGEKMQPLAGTRTAIRIGSYQSGKALCGTSGFQLWNLGNDESFQKKIEIFQVDTEKKIRTLPFSTTVSADNLKENILYLLRITLEQDKDSFFYDLPFYYVPENTFVETLKEVRTTILEETKAEIPMGDMAMAFQMVHGNHWSLAIKYITAIRDRDNYSYFEHYYTIRQNEVGEKFWIHKKANKKRGQFDKVQNSVILAEEGQFFWKDNSFVQIFDKEVYAGDTLNLYTLYRYDRINEDYLIDELTGLQVNALGWMGNRFYFLLYGHFDSTIPQAENRHGIMIAEWNGETLEYLSFLEVPDADIPQYFRANFVLQDNYLSWKKQDIVYSLQLDTRSLWKSKVPFHSLYLPEQDIYLWQAEPGKKNQAVLWKSFSDQLVYEIYQEGRQRRFLHAGKEGIYIGEYRLEDTVEYLNREVDYAFTKILLYSAKGEIIKKWTAPVRAYFGMPTWTNEVMTWDVLYKEHRDTGHRGEQKIRYLKKERKVEVLPKPVLPKKWRDTSGLGMLQTYYGMRFYLFPGKHRDPLLKTDAMVQLHQQTEEKSSHFFLLSSSEKRDASTFAEAIQLSPKNQDYQIYYQEGDKEYLYFDTMWKKERAFLKEFEAVPQMPELPRGCEITALSSLLQYYSKNFPSRFDLAKELEEYSNVAAQIPYQVDMKEAFAGSMYRFEEPGLGVYIEPISVIAKRYLGKRVQTVIGLELAQILTLVSRGIPVQVIVSDTSAEIPESGKVFWKTDNGFIQVSYREHSVVVIGFDENYIFYADPLSGRIEKSLKSGFEGGYQSFGKQALFVLPE